MAGSHRRANENWDAAEKDNRVPSWERVNTIVLMDIRAELQRLNSLLHCQNFINIPRQLEPIAKMAKRANTNAAKRRKAVKR